MVSALDSSTSTTSSTAAAPGTTATQPLDRDAFLKLLVAQMSNQDPTKPMEGTEFVSQLSQFASVEQSMQQTTKLDDITNAVNSLTNAQATSLVGKTATVSVDDGTAADGSTKTRLDTGTVTSVSFGDGGTQLTLSDGTSAATSRLVSINASDAAK